MSRSQSRSQSRPTGRPTCQSKGQSKGRSKGRSTEKSHRSGTVARWCLWLAMGSICLSGVASSSAVAGSPPAFVLEELPLAPATQRSLVADSMTINRTQASVMSLSSRLPVVDVLDFYRAYWRDGRHELGSIDSAVGAWEIVSRLDPNGLLVVQMRPGDKGGSRGFVSLTRPEPHGWQGSVGGTQELPVPPMAERIARTHSADAQGMSLVSVFASQLPPSVVGSFYRRVLNADHWHLLLDEHSAGTESLAASAPQAAVDVSIVQRGGASMITVVQRVPAP